MLKQDTMDNVSFNENLSFEHLLHGLHTIHASSKAMNGTGKDSRFVVQVL